MRARTATGALQNVAINCFVLTLLLRTATATVTLAFCR